MDLGNISLTILGSGGFSALVTYLLNRGFNNKKLNAEIVSKSRIDWISDFRSLSSKYVYDVYQVISKLKLINDLENFMQSSRPLSNDKNRFTEKLKEENDLLDKYIYNMVEDSIQIRLFLPKRNDETEQEEHKEIKAVISDITSNIDGTESDIDTDYIGSQLTYLTDYIAKYLKQEWDIAKEKK